MKTFANEYMSLFLYVAVMCCLDLVAYRQPLVYNFSVFRELLKQVYVAERLQPPTSLSTITNVYSTIWSRAISPQYWRGVVRSGEWAKLGIYAIEAYGIFKVCPFPYLLELVVQTISTDW